MATKQRPMTAKQAIDAAKDYDFNKVWAELMETRAQQARKEQAIANLAVEIDKVTKNVGGLTGSLGRFMEAMFSAEPPKNFKPKEW
jgi:hypothetical protein